MADKPSTACRCLQIHGFNVSKGMPHNASLQTAILVAGLCQAGQTVRSEVHGHESFTQ